MNNYYILQPTSNDIQHHGVLGQKWGDRNGPPYPLGSSAHSSSEKKAGWKKSLDNGSSWHSKNNIKKLQSDLEKNNIKDEETKEMLKLELKEAKKEDKKTFTIKELQEKPSSEMTAREYATLYDYTIAQVTKTRPDFVKWMIDKDIALAYDPHFNDDFIKMYDLDKKSLSK